MASISNNIELVKLSLDSWNEFFSRHEWLDKKKFEKICERYGYPQQKITVVIENYYIDEAYRDIYYHYWSSFHFDWPRYCKRLFLFLGHHELSDFFNTGAADRLGANFLGTIVIRPAYSDNTDHTFGRTLLNPYRMIDSDNVAMFSYLETKPYSFHLLGNIYTVDAFPFCSQDGVVMKCAETSIYELFDYASANSKQFARVLPSDLQERLRLRLSERILPSHGLYCHDISYLLCEFGFSPKIYVKNTDNEAAVKRDNEKNTIQIGIVGSLDGSKEKKSAEEPWFSKHIVNFEKMFHYYVESSIPLLTIISPNKEEMKHATLVIGHGKKTRSFDECKINKLGDLPCMDTAELYEDYIIQDDNQIPYVEEKINQFTTTHDHRLEAFIVPLDKHVFLEAMAAVNIFDVLINQERVLIQQAIEHIGNEVNRIISTTPDSCELEQYKAIIEAMKVTLKNPLTIRYFMAMGDRYKRYRIYNSGLLEDKLFYANIPMPKFVWVAEISTYDMYKMGYAFSEVVLDATAANESKLNAVILMRMAHFGVYRLPNEEFKDFFKNKIEASDSSNLASLFNMYSNFNDAVKPQD